MTRAVVLTLTLIAAIPLGATQQPVFRSGVDVVRIDVSVMQGVNPVAGLTAENFIVTDKGVEQKLDSVSLDRVPLSLMMVFDTSASLAGERLSDLIAAGNDLVKALRPDDAAALLTFSEPIRLAVPMATQRSRLLSQLNSLKANGATALNDAVFMALQLRPADSGTTRPVALVFSDGQDTSSWLTGTQAIEAARRSGILIHVVELSANPRGTPFAHGLADAGGGRVWRATSGRALRELFGKVLEELRARYLLTYTPTGVAGEGWHDVKVTLKGARGDVTARPGYFVAPQ
jgi:Ca-activated chloride channel homolog